MLKECKKHGLTEFSWNKQGKKKPQLKCRKCATEAVQKRRKVLKEMAVAYKGGKCVKCGYNKCLRALEFHHTDKNKEFGIGAKGYTRSWVKVKDELDKCILVCSNCHKEIEDEILIAPVAQW